MRRPIGPWLHADARFVGSSYFPVVPDLFTEENLDSATGSLPQAGAPLATRMRPRSLDEFVGQEHILAPGKLLRRAIEADRLPSVILSGPPGTGKTTLAHIIADMTHAKFIRLSGVESNVAEMRRALAAATTEATVSPGTRAPDVPAASRAGPNNRRRAMAIRRSSTLIATG